MDKADKPTEQLADLLDTISQMLRYDRADSGTLRHALEALDGIAERGYYARQVDKMREAEAQED